MGEESFNNTFEMNTDTFLSVYSYPKCFAHPYSMSFNFWSWEVDRASRQMPRASLGEVP